MRGKISRPVSSSTERNGHCDKCLHQYAELNTEHNSRRRNVSQLIGSRGWRAFVLNGAIS